MISNILKIGINQCESKVLSPLKLLLISLLIFSIQCPVLPISYQANAATSYRFLLFNQNAVIPSGSTMQIQMPYEFSMGVLKSASASYVGYDAAFDQCPTDSLCTGVNFSFSGGAFVFTGLFPSSASPVMTYTISPIKNPSAAITSSPFTVNFIAPDGSIAHTQILSGVTYTTATMACSGSLGNNQLWSSSILTLNSSPLFTAARITITFPSVWLGESRVSSTISGSVSCSSPTHQTLYCQKVLQTVTVNRIYHTAGQAITIRVSSVSHPSAVMNVEPIVITTLNSLGQQVESCTVSLPSSQLVPNTLVSPSSSITNPTTTSVDLSISFTLPKTYLTTDTVSVQVPSQLVLPTSVALYTVVVGTTTLASSVITIQTATNTLKLRPFLAVISKPSFSLTIRSINRPRECLTTGNILITSLRANLHLLDSQSCCAVKVPAKESLNINSFTPSSLTRLSSGLTYEFIIAPSLISLVPSDILMISYPQAFLETIKPTNGVVCTNTQVSIPTNPSLLAASPLCTVQSGKIKLSAFLINNLAIGNTIKVTIQNVHSNPIKSPTQPFTIWTASTRQLILESSSAVSLVLTPTQMSAPTLTISSSVCSAVASYSFVLVHSGPLARQQYVQISFPTEITAIKDDQLACSIKSVTSSCSVITRSPLSIRVYASQSVSARTSTVVIAGIVNPHVVTPTGSFSIGLYDLVNNLFEAGTIASLTPLTPSTFLQASVNRGTQVQLGTSISLTFDFVVPYIPLSAQSVLTVLWDSSKATLASMTCSHSFLSATCSTTTFTAQSSLVVNNIQASPSDNRIHIVVSGFTLIDAIGLSFTATLNVGASQSAETAAGFGIANILREFLPTASLTQDNYIMGALAVPTLNFAYSHPSLSRIVVTVPTAYTTSSYTLNLASSLVSAGALQLPQMTSPQAQSSFPFMVRFLDTQNKVLALTDPTLATLAFSIDCKFPCRTCQAGQPSACKTCYQVASIRQAYFLSSQKLCVEQCPIGYLAVGNNCNQCDLSCVHCGADGVRPADIRNCLLCPTGNYLLNGICYANCPTGFYPTASICAACLTTCSSCTSLNVCLTCAGSNVLSNSKCLSTCPAQTAQLANTCLICPSNCAKCSIDAANSVICVLCWSNFYLVQGSCLSNCPALPTLMLVSKAQTCSVCQCLTCSPNSYTCLSCSSPAILHNSGCYSSCPQGHYSERINGIDVCSICPTECLRCTARTVCVICRNGYTLHQLGSTVECILTCPLPKVRTIDSTTLHDVCLPCSASCLTCATTRSFCTSCAAPLLLSNNQCLVSCSPPLFNVAGVCRLCAPECSVCSSQNPFSCTECQRGYFLQGITCFAVCTLGTLPALQTGTCVGCLAMCLTCIHPSRCLTCPSSKFLLNGVCLANCPQSPTYYYELNGACQSCSPTCASCTPTGPYSCTTCRSGLYYQNEDTGHCTRSCTTPYFPVSKRCVKCSSSCVTCANSPIICASCSSDKVLFQGQCLSTCPSGYFQKQKSCNRCPELCLTCTQSKCIACRYFASRSGSTCVLVCPQQTPKSINGICTSCTSIPYCVSCTDGASCQQCIDPMVTYQGSCINSCPSGYIPNTERVCQASEQYLAIKAELKAYNWPIVPPFSFVVLWAIIGLLTAYISYRSYKYSYFYGIVIALLCIVDCCLIIYMGYYILTRFQGDYQGRYTTLPLYLLLAGSGAHAFLGMFSWIFLLGLYYCKDVRYEAWRQSHRIVTTVSYILVPFWSVRFHKFLYSKLCGLEAFSFRILSIDKFERENRFTLASCLADLCHIAAAVILAYYSPLSYSVLTLVPYEVVVIKLIMWLLLIKDYKKPEAGFFFGDEQEAEMLLLAELEMKESRNRKDTLDNLARLIRQKSAVQLTFERLLLQYTPKDNISVYNPDDYEPVPIIPKKQIRRAIRLGKFRKGRKITVQEKLLRFADSIRPLSKKPPTDKYLSKWLYWKPPQLMKPLSDTLRPLDSEEKMLQVLNDKEQLYNLDRIPDRMATGAYFYDPNDSALKLEVESIQPYEQPSQFQDLLNYNYARKKHLAKKDKGNHYDDYGLRVLHHSPRRRRRDEEQDIEDYYLQAP